MVAVIVPTAPEANLTMASAVSSTSMSCAWVVQAAVTSVVGPMHQRSRSTVCTPWFISAPPPSSSQVPRHGALS